MSPILVDVKEKRADFGTKTESGILGGVRLADKRKVTGLARIYGADKGLRAGLVSQANRAVDKKC